MQTHVYGSNPMIPTHFTNKRWEKFRQTQHFGMEHLKFILQMLWYAILT